jgi:hypothetical protein
LTKSDISGNLGNFCIGSNLCVKSVDLTRIVMTLIVTGSKGLGEKTVGDLEDFGATPSKSIFKKLWAIPSFF